MPAVGFDVDRLDLLRRDSLAGGVASLVESSTNHESAVVRGVCDQVDDGLVGAEGATAPVDRDERKEAVLDLVPLAGPWREMTDADGEAEFVGDALQIVLPDVGAVAVAATGVGGDENLARVGIPLRTDLFPPRLDGGDREHRGVVIDADADEPVVGTDVVDAVRDHLADRVLWEVMDIDELRLVLGLPLAAAVLEVADQLLLLGVDRDHRHAALKTRLRGLVDVLELRVAVGMLLALDGLVRCLQAVPVIAQQFCDRPVTDPDPMLCEQLTGEDLGALARPAQWRFWVASGRRVDELFQRRPDLGVHLLERPLAGAAPHADDVAGLRASPSFIPALPDRADRQPRRASDRCDAAEADRSGLGTRPQSALPLIHGRLQQAPLLSDQLLGVVRRPHSGRRSHRGLRVDPSRSFSIETRSRTAFAGPKGTGPAAGASGGAAESGPMGSGRSEVG